MVHDIQNVPLGVDPKILVEFDAYREFVGPNANRMTYFLTCKYI